MSAYHPVHSLCSTLEAERLRLVRKLAAGGHSADTVQELATVQTALTAVREEIASHSVRLGGGSEDGLP